MATFSGEEQLDLLIKKLFYGVAKGGSSDNYNFSNEVHDSFLAVKPSNIWTNAASIPSSPPTNTSSTVEVYTTNAGASQNAPLELTAVSLSGNAGTYSNFRKQWVALDGSSNRLKNWIGPGYGGAYAARVYVGGAGWDGTDSDATAKGIQEISFGGNAAADWFFDYEAGVLFWTNENLGETGAFEGSVAFTTDTSLIANGDKVYIKGYRYVGGTGLGSATNVTVSDSSDDTAFKLVFTSGASSTASLLVDDSTPVTYNPSTGVLSTAALTASVSFSTGTLQVNGNTTLGNEASDTITLNAQFASDLLPSANNSKDLGSSSLKWAEVHATTFHGALTGNADTVTTNANLTGHITSSGNATSLGSFTIAQLSTALSDASISGDNSGDQTITLTGDVTGSGGGSFAATITDDAVTYAKLQDLTTANRLLGGTTAGTIAEVQVATDMIADNAVTVGKLADAINTSISNNASAASAAQTTANAALPKAGGTMTGNIVFNGAQPNGNGGLVPATGTDGHFLKHDGTFGQVAYANISSTPNLGTIASQNSDGVTITGGAISGTNITVGSSKTLDVSGGTLTLANNQISGDAVEGGTIDATTITTLTSSTIQATTLKANDGTAAGSIADNTGVVTLASSVLTTTDINGGTIDGTTIGATTKAAASFTDVTITGDLTVVGTGTQISLAQENVLFKDALLTLGNADTGTNTDYSDAAAMAEGTKLGIEAYKQNHNNTAHPSLIFDTTAGNKYWAIDNKDHAASAEQRIARIFKVAHTILTAEISAGFFTVTHNLNHEDLIVQVRDNSADQEVIFFKYKTKTAQTIEIYVGSNFSNGDIVNVVVVG